MTSIWACVFAGTVLLLAGGWVGWTTAQDRSSALPRFMHWWLSVVLLPHVTARRWLRRAVTIAVNNLAVLTGVMLLGPVLVAALAGVAACGVAIGLALRVLPEIHGGDQFASTPQTTAFDRRVRIGLALNMLEPPAILFAVGLAIGQGATGVYTHHAWTLFAAVVIPAMLVAAGGEALWIGAVLESGAENETHAEDPPTDDDGP